MGIFSAPKPPPIPEIKIPEPPPPPEPDPAIEETQKEELERAEKARVSEIQKRLRDENALFARNRSSGRTSLLSSGRAGFSLRSLIGG